MNKQGVREDLLSTLYLGPCDLVPNHEFCPQTLRTLLHFRMGVFSIEIVITIGVTFIDKIFKIGVVI